MGFKHGAVWTNGPNFLVAKAVKVPQRIALIGQAPAKEAKHPFEGATGKRIASLSGVSYEELGHVFHLSNVLPYWPWRQGKGDAFPMREAKLLVTDIPPFLVHFDRVVFVGAQVAKAFNFKKRVLTWHNFRGITTSILPHPSGVNRWFNDERNRERASQFLKKLVKDFGV